MTPLKYVLLLFFRRLFGPISCGLAKCCWSSEVIPSALACRKQNPLVGNRSPPRPFRERRPGSVAACLYESKNSCKRRLVARQKAACSLMSILSILDWVLEYDRSPAKYFIHQSSGNVQKQRELLFLSPLGLVRFRGKDASHNLILDNEVRETKALLIWELDCTISLGFRR